MASTKKSNIFNNISMISLGIDVLLWIQLIAVFGYNVYIIGTSWRTSVIGHILIQGTLANLFTMTMLAIELYGTSKKNILAIIVSLIIRFHRIIMFVGFSLAIPLNDYFRSVTSLWGTALYYNCFIFIVWDILKMILKVTNIIIIIQRRKFPEEPIYDDCRIVRDPVHTLNLDFE